VYIYTLTLTTMYVNSKISGGVGVVDLVRGVSWTR
jgi:hypothetical protein